MSTLTIIDRPTSWELKETLEREPVEVDIAHTFGQKIKAQQLDLGESIIAEENEEEQSDPLKEGIYMVMDDRLDTDETYSTPVHSNSDKQESNPRSASKVIRIRQLICITCGYL